LLLIIIKIAIFALLTFSNLYYILPYILLSKSTNISNKSYNQKYFYSVDNNTLNKYINTKAFLLEYHKFYKNKNKYNNHSNNPNKVIDSFFKVNSNKLITKNTRVSPIKSSNINFNSIRSHYLPLYNPLQSIEILQQLYKNYTINFNCKTTCESHTPINNTNLLNNRNNSKNNTNFEIFNNNIYTFEKLTIDTLNSKDDFDLYYRKNLEYIFRNYSINDIYYILQTELHNCIYCCCTETPNYQTTFATFDKNKKFSLGYQKCSAFYDILHNQLEDIIIKLYLEILTEDNNFEYSDIYTIDNNLNLDLESQRKYYINNFDSQSFLQFISNYCYHTPTLSNSNKNTLFQKLLSFINIYKDNLLYYFNELTNYFFVDTFSNLFNHSSTKKKMSDKQYTNEYAVQVSEGVDPKGLAEKLGLTFAGQIGELKGYYLFKVENTDVKDIDAYRTVESNLDKEKSIEWYERQYLKSFQKRSVC